MNKGRILISMVIIVVALALSLGATLAFFTYDMPARTNTFQAGTVEITDGGEVVTGGDMGNVNPGDCFEKCFTIINTGSKAIELRMTDFAGEWSFNDSTSTLPLLYDNGPLYIAPHHENDWKMRQVGDSFEFYYTDGPIAAGESVELCMIIAFDREIMDDKYQGITLTLDGTFSAVQASNDAPVEVWNDADWASWKGENGWFSLNHYDGLAYFDEDKTIENMGSDYADYYWTTKCFNGNGGNGQDPEPKLTIEKELKDSDGNSTTTEDVEFGIEVKGGTGAFKDGLTYDIFAASGGGVTLDETDGLEFDVTYEVTEVNIPSGYSFVGITISGEATTTVTLTDNNNENEATVIVENEMDNGTNGGTGETAFAGENKDYNRGWYRYFGFDTNSTTTQTQTIYASNSDIDIGTAKITKDNDTVTIEINLSGWKFDPAKDEQAKVKGYDSPPTTRPSLGRHDRDYPSSGTVESGSESTISGIPLEPYYVIKLDVVPD